MPFFLSIVNRVPEEVNKTNAPLEAKIKQKKLSIIYFETILTVFFCKLTYNPYTL